MLFCMLDFKIAEMQKKQKMHVQFQKLCKKGKNELKIEHTKKVGIYGKENQNYWRTLFNDKFI